MGDSRRPRPQPRGGTRRRNTIKKIMLLALRDAVGCSPIFSSPLPVSRMSPRPARIWEESCGTQRTRLRLRSADDSTTWAKSAAPSTTYKIMPKRVRVPSTPPTPFRTSPSSLQRHLRTSGETPEVVGFAAGSSSGIPNKNATSVAKASLSSLRQGSFFPVSVAPPASSKTTASKVPSRNERTKGADNLETAGDNEKEKLVSYSLRCER